MDRMLRQSPLSHALVAVLLAATTLAASGCAPILATGVYLWQGGNVVPAECRALENKRVVVVCRPPSLHEYRQSGASRALAERVSYLLVENVKGIDVVNPREVDNWADEESDWSDFRELAKAVKAEMVLHIELDDFSLYEGKTLYRGRTDVAITVYDMNENGKDVWTEPLGEILYPRHSGIPAQDKPVQHFEREFISVLAQRIAEYFYKHDPNSMFALDSMANH